MNVLSDKQKAVLIKAAAAIKDRGHEGDARLADSVLGIIQSLATAQAPSAPVAREVVEGYAMTLIDRSYDQRVKAIIAHNQCDGDLDDKLKAAYEAAVFASPIPPQPSTDICGDSYGRYNATKPGEAS